MSNAKILAFSGSCRAGSLNDKLLQQACQAAIDTGAEVTHINLGDYPLPIYGQDVEEQGFPENATKLKELFKQHSALSLACPEYNSSITPLLKNTIDWVSRPGGDSGPLEAFADKTACLIAASPGALGGLRGLRHVREILSNIRVLVVPNQFALTSAAKAFGGDGSLADEKQAERLKSCVKSFVSTANNQAS